MLSRSLIISLLASIILFQNAFAVITIKTVYGSTQVQIAWSTEAAFAHVVGTPVDEPRIMTHLPQYEALATISDTLPFILQLPKGQIIYLAIAAKGAKRSQQLRIPVLDGATVVLEDLGDGDLALVREIDLVNSTDQTINVNLVHQETERGYVPNPAPSSEYERSFQDYEEHFFYKQLPGTRTLTTQQIVLAPVAQPLKNNSTSECFSTTIRYRLYTLFLKLRPVTYTQALNFVNAKGLLTAGYRGKASVNHCSLHELVPLAGDHDVIEFGSQPRQPSWNPLWQNPIKSEESYRLCGIFTLQEASQDNAPCIRVYNGTSWTISGQ